MERISLNDLLTATGGKPAAGECRSVSFDRVSIDSRRVEPGDLFWAIPGERHDGHDFIDEARMRGGVACVARSGSLLPSGIAAAIVPDTLTALKDFARWYRERRDALVVGVTGSVGKTTTREMIYAALSARLAGCRSPKNYNNHVGLPLALLQIEQQHRFAVLEMGASRLGEIRSLAEVALPKMGVVTRIAVSHLEGFGSIEAICEAKGELIESLPSDGVAFLNGDDPHSKTLASRSSSRVVQFGARPENDVRATHVEVSGTQLRFRVGEARFTVRAAGRHHVSAALAAIAIAREVGLTDRQIAEGLAAFVPMTGRCRLRELANCTLIDDSYNSNPGSAEAACKTLGDWKTEGRRILVLGDMAELGADSIAWHQKLGVIAAEMNIDRLVTFGRHAEDVTSAARRHGMAADQLAHTDEFDVLLSVLDSWIEPGDVVLVKGSRSMRMERVSEWLIQNENSKELISPRGNTRACA